MDIFNPESEKKIYKWQETYKIDSHLSSRVLIQNNVVLVMYNILRLRNMKLKVWQNVGGFPNEPT